MEGDPERHIKIVLMGRSRVSRDAHLVAKTIKIKIVLTFEGKEL